MSESKQSLEELLKQTEEFLQSPLYRHFRYTVSADLDMTQQSILHGAPASLDEVLAKQKLYGEKEFLEKQVQIFEEFRAVLKEKLANIV